MLFSWSTAYHPNLSITVKTLPCSADDKVECSGKIRKLSCVMPVAVISFDFFNNSAISLILANPGTKIRIAPALKQKIHENIN